MKLTEKEKNIALFRQDPLLYDIHGLVETIGSVIDMRDHYNRYKETTNLNLALYTSKNKFRHKG